MGNTGEPVLVSCWRLRVEVEPFILHWLLVFPGTFGASGSTDHPALYRQTPLWAMPPNSQQCTTHQAHLSGVPRDPDRLSDKQLPEVADRVAMPILRAVWVSKLREPLSGLPLSPSQQTSSVLVGLPRGVPHKTPAGMATLKGCGTRDMTKGTGHSPGPLGEFSTLQMPLVIWKCCKELRARLSQHGPTISAMP